LVEKTMDSGRDVFFGASASVTAGPPLTAMHFSFSSLQWSTKVPFASSNHACLTASIGPTLSHGITDKHVMTSASAPLNLSAT
jgi:hypothetical protein